MEIILVVPLSVIANAVAVIFPFVTIINLLGLGFAFCPEQSRNSNIANLRDEYQFTGYSDWQIVALLVLLAMCPYLNLLLFSSALSVTTAKIGEVLEPFGKKKG